MPIDTAAVTNNGNSKVLRIGAIVEDRARSSADQMNAIAAIVDEWRSGVGPVHAPPAPRDPEVDAVLHGAFNLLGNARCTLADPASSRAWGQQKRRVRDRIMDLLGLA